MKGRVLCDSIYVKCPEEANPYREQTGGCQGLGGAGGEGAITARLTAQSWWGQDRTANVLNATELVPWKWPIVCFKKKERKKRG